MNRYRLSVTSGLVALLALGVMGVAQAQEQGFPPPPPGGGQGFGGPGFGGPGQGGPGFGGPQGQGPRGPMGQRGPQPELTAARIPADVLANYLDLNDSQEKKIETINKEFAEKTRSMRPRPPQGGPGQGGPGQDGPGFGGPRDGQRGGPPPGQGYQQGGFDGPPQGGPPQGGQPGGRGFGGPQGGPNGQGRPGGPPPLSDEQRQKMQDAEKKAQKAIDAELTDAQKKKLPELLKALTALQRDGLAPEVSLKLKLSDAQITKLAALGKDATTRKIERILTDEQSEYAEAHRHQGPPMGGPQGPPPGGGQGFGGRPGQGGPPPGGFGGPEQGGPPPGGPDF